MDTYDPATVFSSIDTHGRYAYGNQPGIAAWNLARFAETLLPLLHDNQERAIQIANDTISEFPGLFRCNWLRGMRTKLGIINEEEEDETLINNLLSLMHKFKADFTNTFRALSLQTLPDNDLFNSGDFVHWYELWQARLERQNKTREKVIQLMNGFNPAVIPRNQRVEEALEAAVKYHDLSVMERLLKILAAPYEQSSEFGAYYIPAPGNTQYRTFCGT